MTTFLLYGSAIASPDMRHEIAEPVADPVIFIEHDGKRILAGSILEAPLFSAREDLVDEYWNVHDLGAEEIMADTAIPSGLIGPELIVRALKRIGSMSVVVPPTFPVLAADHLRSRNIEVVVDAEAWAARRRRKTPWEIEGIVRAQAAAEMALSTAARMLRAAEPTGSNRLRFEGEILTAELVREAMIVDLTAQKAECDDIMIQSGDACLKGHEPGMGPILPDQSCIIDCYPRDRKTGAYTDVARTFVAGRPSKELVALHRHCRTALDIAVESVKPGASDAYAKVVEYFDALGFPTVDRYIGDGALTEGFTHSLGHGVGLEIHERPWVGRRADEFVAGDVVALEPGLYFKGIGGVRLEDTVVVTDDGAEYLTQPFPYELQP